jgi:cyclophilin family peptidyl-prolyl cis-trans isomerase
MSQRTGAKRRTTLLSSLAACLILGCALAPAAEQKPAAGKAPAGAIVSTSLKTTQDVYEVGATVRAELTIENLSAEWTPIPDTSDLARYLRLTGDDGKALEPVKADRFGAAKTKELGPGGFVGLSFDASMLFPALAQPGSYRLSFKKGGLASQDVPVRVIPAFDPSRKYQLKLAIPELDLVVDLFAKNAPVAVHNIVSLARTGFFDGAAIPRIEPGVMIGVHGPVTPAHRIVPFEKTSVDYLAGTVLLEASAERERANYPNLVILLGPAPAWQGQYTAIGQVVSGLAELQKFALRPTTGKDGKPPFRPIVPIGILKASVVEAP